jgi:hypothetical protein
MRGIFRPGQKAINTITENAGNRAFIAPNRRAQALAPAGTLVFNPSIPDLTVVSGSASMIPLFDCRPLFNADFASLGALVYVEAGTWPGLCSVNPVGVIQGQPVVGSEGVYTGLRVIGQVGGQTAVSNEFSITVTEAP